MAEDDRGFAAWALAKELARARTETQVAGAVARAAGALLHAESVRVWAFDRTRGYRFSGSWPLIEEPPEAPSGDVARAVVFAAPMATEAKAPFRSCLVIPLHAGTRPLGAIEILEADRPEGPLDSKDASRLTDLVGAADAALEALGEVSARENAHVTAIARLARLFDIGRSLASRLEMEPLVQAVVSRVQASLEVGSVYLWLLDEAGEKLSVAAAVGPAAEAVEGWEVEVGVGVAGRAAAGRESVRVLDPEDLPELAERPDVAAGLEVLELAAVPVINEDDVLLGALEVVLSEADQVLGKGDLVFLSQIGESTAVALGNARRLDAERRATDLGSLLAAAQELGSSLDIQKVAFTLVHQAASVLRYRKAAVALLRGTRLELAAVSGNTFVDEKLPETKALRLVLEWAVKLPGGIYVVQNEDGSIDTDREETREKFREYFEKTGCRSFLTLPLEDDEGRLGVFAMEASESYAFGKRELEAAGILAAQATIAVRNALLYQQIPMFRVLRPRVGKGKRLAGGRGSRLLLRAGGTALAALVLFAVPVPLRVSGEARVLPERRIPVTAEVEGRVASVLIREGDPVESGQVLGVLEEGPYRVGLEDASARYQVALRERSRARAEGRAADAAVESERLLGLEAELDLARSSLERTRLRSRVPGVAATARIEEKVGSRLARGEVFCEVVDAANPAIDVAVAEQDIGLIAAGMPVKIKLNAFPERSFRGSVERIAVAASEEGSERVFLVRTRPTGTFPRSDPG